jgi:hypothetical protein
MYSILCDSIYIISLNNIYIYIYIYIYRNGGDTKIPSTGAGDPYHPAEVAREEP